MRHTPLADRPHLRLLQPLLHCGVNASHPGAVFLTPSAGEVTAAQALLTACEECSKVCKHIGNVFDAAVQQYQQEHPGGAQQQSSQDVEMAD